MNNSFFDQFDPTKDLTEELSNISIQKQYNTLTEREKKLVFLSTHGYYRMPPTIETLYSDDYYLGGTDFYDGGNAIYQFWKEELPKIFPSELTTAYPMLILSGAIENTCGEFIS